MAIFTFSPATNPPVSILASHLTPKSNRLISVMADNAITVFPHACTRPLYTASRTTGFVTPRMVRSPAILYVASPVFENELLLNVISGYFAASRKSGDLR